MFDAGALLLLIGGILYVGVVSSILFERYRLPDVLNLMGIGLLLGPVLHLISPAQMTPWMPTVGAVALSLILFEGGLDLDFDHVLTRFGPAFALASGTFLLSAGGIAAAYRALSGAPWTSCGLLGASLGCVSSAVIIPVAARLHISEHARTTINLEAALSDLLGVILTLVLLRLTRASGHGVGAAVNSALGAFPMGVAGGAAFGLLWLWALDRLRVSPFSYMMTLAALFVLYGATELADGSGPMAALTFGIFLTNADKIARIFGGKFRFELDEKIRQFNTEATFFVRTFFFVYLGLIVSLQVFDLRFYLISGAVFAVVYLARRAVLRAAKGWFAEDHSIEVFRAMIPRGLTSAVLAGLAWHARVPGAARFLDYTFALILLSNAYMTALIWRRERRAAA